uniref:CFAP61 dimerisation domain-containing protein n=1 Tax=Timema bartmani TaxID=61472 RepID=A0A7R9F540_9NEOP|nr:unnamed protein product [Timema bartmani]
MREYGEQGGEMKEKSYYRFPASYWVEGENNVMARPLGLNSSKKWVVNDAIVAYLCEKEVMIYSDYYFVGWTMNRNQSNVCSAKFQTRTKYIDIQCDALFFYGNKDVSLQTFSALNNASLVYNGRLVINTRFQTNDAYIFAGGSLTKYAGRLYADKYNHCYYNAVEVGSKMAQEMLKIWDPTVEPTGRGETLNNILPHTFTKPLVINCQLPGKINFLHVLKPGVIVPIQAIIQQESYGTIYVTGDCQGEHPSYFKLHFNSHRKVETIVCYTKRKIDVNNMIRLYGKHERLLNNFVTRFESGDITDLYEYFSEPWCMLIFQDHFDQLENDIRGFLLSPTSCPDKNILADIYKACEETRWNKLIVTNPHTPSSPSVLVLALTSLASASDVVSAEVQLNLHQCMDEKYPELLDKFSKSVDKELVEEKLLQHIEDNCYHLTMYAYPKVIKLILYGHEDSPLHR